MDRSEKSTPHPARKRTYKGPVGGWGSLEGITKVAVAERDLPVAELMRQNKNHGFTCTSCAWAKPAEPHVVEFCENGAKATLWDMTHRRCTPEFFAQHTVSELLDWSDYDLEHVGRLTDPMRYDAQLDRYTPCGWDEAYAAIGAALKPLDPTSVVFYASGRASLETSYMYALMARMYGSQNLPDSSNMCHESSSVGLRHSLGSPVGTVTLDDFPNSDCLLFFGQNPGSNSPRMLHLLQEVARRDAPIITFNPLRERGLEKFINPQSAVQMVTGSATRISSEYYQVKTGGDPAVLVGLCKWLIEADDDARAAGAPAVLDHGFIAEHTTGFEAFADYCRAASWAELERHAGLPRADIAHAAATYAKSTAAIGVYGMGLTQHRHGVQNVRLITNLLMLKGNIGRPGAGVCPVRGHSNVQGQRTVGVTERPELAPLDLLKELYDFEPPRELGLNTVETCEGVLNGTVKGFIGLGGNFLRAIPDIPRVEAAWRDLELTVQIATKLNRSHLINGKTAYLLPCLSRIERDEQASGAQIVSTEDSTSFIHASFGDHAPAGDNLRSEPSIVAGIAQATLEPNPRVDWAAWAGDYDMVRDAIAATYPQWFKDYNVRLRQPGGFYRGNTARKRDFSAMPEGKASFITPVALSATGFEDQPGVYRLMTLRSNDQFNTTVYGYNDRLRGLSGSREILLINEAEMARLGLTAGDVVTLESAAADGVPRRKDGLTVTPYNLPDGCLGGYYPECNVLAPVSHFAEESMTPAVKSLPVRIVVERRLAAE